MLPSRPAFAEPAGEGAHRQDRDGERPVLAVAGPDRRRPDRQARANPAAALSHASARLTHRKRRQISPASSAAQQRAVVLMLLSERTVSPQPAVGVLRADQPVDPASDQAIDLRCASVAEGQREHGRGRGKGAAGEFALPVAGGVAAVQQHALALARFWACRSRARAHRR